MPGRCCRIKAGAIRALSRNCEAPSGDEPGRLRYTELTALVGRAVSTAPAGKPFLFPSEKRGGFGVELQGLKVSGDSPGAGGGRGLWDHDFSHPDEHGFLPSNADHPERPRDVGTPT